MKKVKVVLLVAVLLLISGCGNRVPFKKQGPLDNAALVYVYVAPDGAFESNPNYRIRINNKRVNKRVKKDEYIVLNLKPTKSINFSATKLAIDEEDLKMNILAGKTYYLKIQGSGSGGFNFTHVTSNIGSEEIKNMGLAGSIMEEVTDVISELIEDPKDTPNLQVKSLSKPDEVQKAYKLKKQGILTDEEYNKLKAEILAK